MRPISYIIIALFTCTLSFGQTTQPLDLTASKITINGTSSLHDWESSVTDFRGTANLILEGEKIVKAENIVLTVVVRSIESGKSVMDKKIMEALKQSKYPTITFKSIEAICHEDQKITCNGNLQIAGVSNKVTAVVGYRLIQGIPEFAGSMNLLMTDYDVEPPVALFGSIKTGDEVTIDFIFQYNSNSNNLNK